MNIQPPNDAYKHVSVEDLNSASADGPIPAPADPKSSSDPTDGGWKSVFSTILLLVTAVGIAFSIAAYGAQSYQVDGHSMEPTLQNNDRLIVNKVPRSIARITHHPYIPKRGDIIIFNEAGLFDASGLAEKQLIKRVIALPGERVTVSGGNITVYNKENPTGFNPDKSGKYKTNQPTSNDVDVTLQSDQVFVCGDNRPNSEDSRYFGPINWDQIVGS